MKRIFLATLILAFSAQASAVTLKIATVTPEGSQWMKDMKSSAAEIKERTQGRVQIKYYGGGVMGNDKKVLGRIRLGSLQGGAFTPTSLVNQYPNLSLYGLPLVFDSTEEAAYVRSRLDAKLEAGLEEAGFVNFGFAAGGFALLMSNSPITTFDDMRGKKVWVPEGDDISAESMKALGLSPVSLPMTDVLTGLQTGLIDIVAMSPVGALVLQWHTKVKYVNKFPLVYTLGFMAVDKRSFNKISAEDQAIVREVMRKTYENFNQVNLADDADAYDALLNAGIESVPFGRDEFEEIREVLRVSNEALGTDGHFSMELYEEMMLYIAEYRREHAVAASGGE